MRNFEQKIIRAKNLTEFRVNLLKGTIGTALEIFLLHSETIPKRKIVKGGYETLEDYWLAQAPVMLRYGVTTKIVYTRKVFMLWFPTVGIIK